VNGRGNHPGKQPSIEIHAIWRLGARTPTWEALWRQIFADLGDVLDQPSPDYEDNGTGLPTLTAEPVQDEV
jgi:hypothetical protein